ncbi:MAG: hypothetical protein K8I03_00830, partial [Ignavibacteria bacterium]|nr:hypothetical protein [Ignavibacteria bacterium]
VLWVPSNISFTLKDEIYLIDLLQYQPEISVENEPEKYEYEYGRYKNVFVFVISKNEIERHKTLSRNEDSLESFQNNIILDYDLDFITLTSESDGSYIFTSYIKPTLYKENIMEENLPN